MKTYLISNEETFYNLSSFQTVDDMDDSIKDHKDAHKLSKGEIEVLEVLARHSCKFPGVSFMTNNKIGQIVGKRRETVSRIRKKLEHKGIIKQYALKREGGDRRETGSAAVIQPIRQANESEVTPEVTPEMSHHKASTKNYIKPKAHIRDGDTPKPSPDELGKRALKTGIPTAIYNALCPFFNAKELYEVYGILLRAKAKINSAISLEEYGENYVDEFYNVVRKYKLGQVRNLKGLLFAAWRNVSNQVEKQEGSRKSTLYHEMNKSLGIA